MAALVPIMVINSVNDGNQQASHVMPTTRKTEILKFSWYSMKPFYQDAAGYGHYKIVELAKNVNRMSASQGDVYQKAASVDRIYLILIQCICVNTQTRRHRHTHTYIHAHCPSIAEAIEIHYSHFSFNCYHTVNYVCCTHGSPKRDIITLQPQQCDAHVHRCTWPPITCS